MRRRFFSRTSFQPGIWPRRMRRSSPARQWPCGECGPVAQMVIQSCWMLGAGRVIAIDRVPERLAMASTHGKAETINFDQEEVYERLNAMTQGRGPDRCIDAVGCEA